MWWRQCNVEMSFEQHIDPDEPLLVARLLDCLPAEFLEFLRLTLQNDDWKEKQVVEKTNAFLAARAKFLREVQEPPVTPLLIVPPAHLRARMDSMKKTGALLDGGCAPLAGHKWRGAPVCKLEA